MSALRLSAVMSEPEPELPAAGHQGLEVTARLFGAIQRMAIALTDAGGSLADASATLESQTGAVQAALSGAGQIAESSKAASQQLSGLADRARGIGGRMSAASDAIERRVAAACGQLADLDRSSNDMDVDVMAAASQVGDLRKSSSGIQNIAREIQLLAVNAGVEAARHGASGRGFAVIAEAVKKLADQTRAATEQTDRHLVKLAATMEHLQARGQANLGVSRRVDADMREVSGGLDALRGAREAVSGLLQELTALGPQVSANAAASHDILLHMADGARLAAGACAEIRTAAARVEHLTGLAGEAGNLLVDSGEELPVSQLAAQCMAAAARISALFEAAVATGRLSLGQLFDETYRPDGFSEPQKYLTAFTRFTDEALPEIQEAVLSADRRISFCAAVDRNGYLPTHNRKFSQPPSDDPVWNAQNSRNRRLFDDRTGLASARNRKPVLLQTYRRDMGGGRFAVINEVASPILVGGRHWGGFRIGFIL
jgi:methyl-accepting chemotaxis protein